MGIDPLKATLKRLLAPLFLAAVVICFFPGLAAMTDFPAAKDTITFSYPHQVELARNIRNGEFPLWSKSANFPVFAESQGAYAHPLHVLLLAVLPTYVASNLFLLIHIYLGLLFAYLFARETGMGRAGSTLTALTFGLSGFFLARTGIYTVVTNGAWLPGLLWFAARYARTGRPREMLWFVGGSTLALVAGQFQLAFYSVLCASAYLLYTGRKRWRSNVLVLGGAALLIAGLTAVQTLPTAELLLHSHRVSVEKAADYSLWPPQLLQLVIPDLFGRAPHPVYAPAAGVEAPTYWGRGSFVESAFYVGVVPLVLACAAALKGKRPFWTVVLVVSVVLSFGDYTPLFRLYELVPPFNLFRGPSRFLFLATAALAVLAGEGLEDFTGRAGRLYYRTAVGFVLLWAATFIALRVAYPLVEEYAFAAAETKAVEAAEKGPERERALTEYRDKAAKTTALYLRGTDPFKLPKILQFAFLACAAALLWIGRKYKISAVVPLLLLILTGADLRYYGRGLNPTTSVSTVKEPPGAARAILEGPAGRTFSSGFELAGDTSAGVGLIHENTHLIWGLDCVVPRTSLREKYHLSFLKRLEECYTSAGGPVSGRTVRTTPTDLAPFSAFGVRYFVRLAPLEAPGTSLVARAGKYRVYLNRGARPRAYLVYNTRVEEDPEDALRYVFGGNFDPAAEVVLERPIETGVPPTGAPAECEIVKHSNNEVLIKYESGADAVLFLSDLYYPGWYAELDGRATPIIRANGVGRAIRAPAGRHTVRYRFRPITFEIGLAVTVLSLLAFVGTFIVEGVLNERKKRP